MKHLIEALVLMILFLVISAVVSLLAYEFVEMIG